MIKGMSFKVKNNDLDILMPDGAVEYVFDFIIDTENVMNSNKIGYAKTSRGQMALNGQRNSQKRKLVEIGRDAAEGIRTKPMTKAFVICEISNSTSGRFDPPNLELTEKHLMDGMVQAGLLEDDNASVIVGGTLFCEHHCTDDEKAKIDARKAELVEHENELREKAKASGRRRKNRRPSAPYFFRIRVFDMDGGER